MKFLLILLLPLGITPVMKHIPGHGLTSKDSHLYLPEYLQLKTLNDQLKLFQKFNKSPICDDSTYKIFKMG